MSKPTVCSRCASGDHEDCVKNFGDWSSVVPPPKWWERRKKLRSVGAEWTCICSHKRRTVSRIGDVE